MKTIIAIVIVIIGAALIYFYVVRDNAPSAITNTPTTQDETFRRDPSSATFTIDDEEITLSAGRSENSLGEETALLDRFAYGDINGDGQEDTVLFLVRTGSGSGAFIYLGAYTSGPVSYRGSEATFIGDRIEPQSISISNGIVNITYLDRKPDEAFAAEPTVRVTKQFVYKNGQLLDK